jgi:hypothetical protein
MRRLTTADVELSDGVFIPKDTTILVSANSLSELEKAQPVEQQSVVREHHAF